MKNVEVKKWTKKLSDDLRNSMKSNIDVLVYMPERSKQNYSPFLKIISLLHHNIYIVDIYRSLCLYSNTLDNAKKMALIEQIAIVINEGNSSEFCIRV